MGKQINYWMEYESFLLVAQKALDLGCTIVREDLDAGTVIESKDLSIITYNTKFSRIKYYFHLSEAGDIKIVNKNGKEYLETSYSATGNSIIEANYSYFVNYKSSDERAELKKMIRRARLYCISGYYDEEENYIPRPECLTKVFDSLARFVKKIAPYTEIKEILTSFRAEDYGRQYEFNHREYITKTCLNLFMNEGYKLGI